MSDYFLTWEDIWLHNFDNFPIFVEKKISEDDCNNELMKFVRNQQRIDELVDEESGA